MGAMRRVNCSAIEDPVPKGDAENTHLTRSGTSCSYCLCLYDDGERFVTPPCCSVKDFGKPGINTATGYPICQPYKTTYDLATGYLRSCALRYDLYGFGAASLGHLGNHPCIANLILSVALTLCLAGASLARCD